MTDWNNCYEKKDTPWEKGKPTPVLGEVMARHADYFHGRVLVPGCGLGHDARWLADQGMQVIGADIAPLAIEQAQALNGGKAVEFRLVNVFDLPEDMRAAFDLVWEHTCLCALPLGVRAQYMRGVVSALKPEGRVAGVFYMNPDLDPGETGPPFGITVEELESLWREVGFGVVDAWIPTVAYQGRLGRERAMVLRRM